MNDELLERDWEFVLDTIYRINMASDIATFADESLACICSLITCTQGTFFPYDEVKGFYNAFHFGTEPKYFDKFLNGSYDNDIFFKLMTVKNYPYAFRDSDLVPESIFLQSRLYNEIYVPQGIYWAIRLELIHHDKLIGQFALFNTKEEGDFSARDVHIGNLLAKHLTLKLSSLQADTAKDMEQESRVAALIDIYHLTQREFQVVSLVADGMTDSEIAEKLFISISTVKKHIYNAYAKIGINNRAQLMKSLL